MPEPINLMVERNRRTVGAPAAGAALAEPPPPTPALMLALADVCATRQIDGVEVCGRRMAARRQSMGVPDPTDLTPAKIASALALSALDHICNICTKRAECVVGRTYL